MLGASGLRPSLDAPVSPIDWISVAELLDLLYPATKGEPAWPPMAAPNALLLSIWYVLSDVKRAVALDLSHVSFICDSYVALLESDAHSLSVNLCSGHAVSIRETIAMLRSLTGHDPVTETDPALVPPMTC